MENLQSCFGKGYVSSYLFVLRFSGKTKHASHQNAQSQATKLSGTEPQKKLLLSIVLVVSWGSLQLGILIIYGDPHVTPFIIGDSFKISCLIGILGSLLLNQNILLYNPHITG